MMECSVRCVVDIKMVKETLKYYNDFIPAIIFYEYFYYLFYLFVSV